jgi:N-acetylneuraminate synthase
MDVPMAKTLIIAEAGVNHNGSVEQALRMIDVAAEAGVDAVKFQTFVPEEVISRVAPKAEYQKVTTGTDQSQLDMVRALQISFDDHRLLMDRCRERGVAFLSTPFDLVSLDFLVGPLGLDMLKLPSGELTNGPLLLAAGRSGRRLILSTGMCTLAEIAAALSVVAWGALRQGTPHLTAQGDFYRDPQAREWLAGHVSLLQCTTEYPAPYADVNLRAMDTLTAEFGLPVGLSDHTVGTVVAAAAVARGATIVEKHFTLDRSLPGPDHKASLEPNELADLVACVRIVEQALGDGVKQPLASERKNMAIARKSLVARTPIAKGEVFTADNLGVKRPGNGHSPMDYWSWLGRKAERDYAADELI